MFERLKYGKIILLKNMHSYRMFKNEDEAEKWGRQLYGEWGDKIKKIEKAKDSSSMFKENSWVKVLIEYYCGYKYIDINNYYRYGNEVNVLSSYRYKAVRLSEQLLQAPRVNENIIVYRYVTTDVVSKLIDANKHNSNKYYLERGFMSTSLIKPKAEDIKIEQCVLKIYVAKGTVGAYVNTVVFRSEYELLLQNNLYIRLCNKPYFDKEINTNVYECKISIDGKD